MHRKNNVLKTVLITVTCVAVAAAIAVGCLFAFRGGGEPVSVVPFVQIGMTEFWGDTQESSGSVTTDKIQTVYLSETQTVTQILVQAGDTVKKGDLLMTFDTTLSDLALEKERLKVEKLKLELIDAQKRLAEINQMRPMVMPPAPDPVDPEENLGLPLAGRYQVISPDSYDGAEEEFPLICWLGGGTQIDNRLMSDLLKQAQALQEKNEQLPPETPAATEATEATDATEPTESTEPTEPTEPEDPDIQCFFVIFKITYQDMSQGHTVAWQGLKVTYRVSEDSFTFQFFDADAVSDPTLEEPELPEFDFGSGFTAEQIAQMRAEQQKAIKELEFNLKMAETDYKIMQTEVGDGNIYAQIDGTVVSLLTPEEAQMIMQPLMKVSGGGGFYITGSVSELVLGSMALGQEVTVNDWYSGMTYPGTVVSVEEFPVEDQYYYGAGNPNVSFYNFTVFVDESANMMEGNYVSIQFSAANVESGLFLANPYLRTEGGRSFVFVKGEDGRLEKRFVTTGRSLWGSYTEILSGLSETDLLAFPYGKDVVEGAPTVEEDPYGMIMY